MEKAEQLSGRLREALSRGRAYVLTRLGLDPGLEPDLAVLSAAGAALVLLVLVLVALSRAPFGRTPRARTGSAGAEEPRKRSRKKPLEKVTGSRVTSRPLDIKRGRSFVVRPALIRATQIKAGARVGSSLGRWVTSKPQNTQGGGSQG